MKEKLKKYSVLKHSWRVKEATGNLEPAAIERAGPLGGGRGKETLPLGACLEVFRVWKAWFKASTRLEARDLGGFRPVLSSPVQSFPPQAGP